jgi:hypothetical protein
MGAGEARRFKSLVRGAGQDEKNQEGLSSGRRELERPPVDENWLKVYLHNNKQ